MRTLLVALRGHKQQKLDSAMDGGLIINPAHYPVSVEDMEHDTYGPGDAISITVTGLKPGSSVVGFLRIFTGGPGFPYFSGSVLLDAEDDAMYGEVDEEGSVTFTGVMDAQLAEGHLVIILPAYGYSIDSNLDLEKEGRQAEIVLS